MKKRLLSLLLASCFGLSLLGAALITLLIEKPCAKVLKKMFARGKAENKA